MKTSTIGLFCSAKRSSQFQGPAKSKGYILENLTNAMVVVGATALVAAGAVGTMVLFDQAISSYQDNKTATVHNSEGHVVGEDSSGGYFTSVVMPDGRGGSTTSQQYVPESYLSAKARIQVRTSGRAFCSIIKWAVSVTR